MTGNSMRLPIKVISLPGSLERRAAFAANNGHVAYDFFDAVDGKQIQPQMARLPDLFAPGLEYTAGAVGCALSHLTLWQDVVDSQQPLTILEDDAILRHDFETRAAQAVAGLPADWDIVVWGWNFDSILSLNILPGISPAVVQFNQTQLRATMRNFQALTGAPAVLRLGECFGTCAYTISPAGARRFMAACFPLRPFRHYVQGIKRDLPNNGIDIPMIQLYGMVNAFCAMPPLAATRNDRTASLVQAP